MRKSLFTVNGPTDPIYDLTTVDDVNLVLGITGNTADDAIMAKRITFISKLIADVCNRDFAALEITENFRVRIGQPVEALYLRHFPVQQLFSITVCGTPADPGLFELDYDSGLLWMKCWRWRGEIIVDYLGGYNLPDDAPPLLTQACIETIRFSRFAGNKDPTIRSTTHGDSTVSFNDYRFGTATGAGATALPPNVNDMLGGFRAKYV
jgi:hypothetical protein